MTNEDKKAASPEASAPKTRKPKPDRDAFFDKHGRNPAPVEAKPVDPDTVVDAKLAGDLDNLKVTDAGDALPGLPKMEVTSNVDLPSATITKNAPATPTEPAPVEPPTVEAPTVEVPAVSTRRDVRSADDKVVTEPFSDVAAASAAETTALPANGISVAEHLTEDPLPYIAPPIPPATKAYALAEPAIPTNTVAAVDDEPTEVHAKRGTLDLGLLILRIAVGGTFVAHGLWKFGLFNGPHIDGFATYLQSGGFNSGWTTLLSWATALTEVGAGALLILGLITPIAGAGLLGVITGAILFNAAQAGGLNFFVGTNGGQELEYLLAAASAALILTGPGLYAADRRWGWSRRPAWGSGVWLLIGLAAGFAVYFIFNGTNPIPGA